MRRLYKAGGITQAQLGKQFGGSQNNITSVLTGVSYAHVPGAVTKHKIHKERRKYPPEVVLLMRLTYEGCPAVSLITLSEAFGSPISTIQRILVGESYADVPGALTQLRPKGKPKMLTDDEVIAARRTYRTRYSSLRILSREYGICVSSMARLIRGQTYKHLPHAVPEHIKTMRRGTKVGPRKSPTKSTKSHQVGESIVVGLEAHK